MEHRATEAQRFYTPVGTDLVSVRETKQSADGHKVRPYGKQSLCSN